jgi:splicing suppressor protein 51
MNSCALPSCGKTAAQTGAALKRCSKCKTAFYCSFDCQKAHWKVHKLVCTSTNTGAAAAAAAPPPTVYAPTPSSSGSRGLSADVAKPFTKLHAKTWLHGRPEKDVYMLLMDSYRLRLEDEYLYEGDAADDSIYGGCADSCVGFEEYLSLAGSRPGLLPSWWNAGKVAACMNLGHERQALTTVMDKEGVIDEYVDPMMPMQMRMFAEQVYLRGIGGMNGEAMMAMQMQMEQGNSGLVSSNIDLNFSRR